MPTRTALVTGASAGIGSAFAELLAAEGLDLLLVARREDRLRELADRLAEKHNGRYEILAADLRDPAAPTAIFNHANGLGIDIDVLINNAGLSGKGAFSETPWDEIGGELQVMVTAVTHLTHLAVPGMRERGWGRVVNLSSLAAFQPPGASQLYTGIKSYILDMSRALDMELRQYGVHVTALCPGFTYSEFHDVMGTREQANHLPGLMWQEPEAVVREGWDAVSKGKAVCVPGGINKFLSTTMRPIPLRAQYVIGKNLNPFKHA
jgi:short-subunit dehydrogenase